MTTTRFVQVETGLRRSKLVDRMVTELEVVPAIVIGCLVLLWSEALEARTRGDLSERSDRWIEDAAGWRGEPGAFAAAVRRHHLDEHGVIRDFEEKYGKLDVQRTKATKYKAIQRSRARQYADGPEEVLDVSSGQTDDSPRIFSSSSSSSPSVVDLEKGKGEPEREGVYNPAAEHPIELIDARFGGFARWPTALVRSSRNPDAVAATLVAHLDGLHGPEYAPEVVALAVQEYLASCTEGGAFKARYFAGFVRRAEDTIAKKAVRVQGQNETRFIRGEVEESDRLAQEVAIQDNLIAEFKIGHTIEYEVMLGESEKTIPAKWGAMMRPPMVRAELARRIREWQRQHPGEV
jgi:hypothetical protein